MADTGRPDDWRPKGPFRFWRDDFERDTRRLTETQKWRYLSVLTAMWEAGGWLYDAEMYHLFGRNWRRDLMPILEAYCTPEVTSRSHLGHKQVTSRSHGERRWTQGRVQKDLDKQWLHSQRTARHRAACDAPSPSPSPSYKQQQGDDAREQAGKQAKKTDPAVGLIAAFDEGRSDAGTEPRGWPAANDITTARRWLEAGIDAQVVRAVSASVHAKLLANGREPPQSLAYIDKPVVEALANGKRDLPKINGAPKTYWWETMKLPSDEECAAIQAQEEAIEAEYAAKRAAVG